MIDSIHKYPLFPDLIENQRKSIEYFWEKGIAEELEFFCCIKNNEIERNKFGGNKSVAGGFTSSEQFLTSQDSAYPVEQQSNRQQIGPESSFKTDIDQEKGWGTPSSEQENNKHGILLGAPSHPLTNSFQRRGLEGEALTTSLSTTRNLNSPVRGLGQPIYPFLQFSKEELLLRFSKKWREGASCSARWGEQRKPISSTIKWKNSIVGRAPHPAHPVRATYQKYIDAIEAKKGSRGRNLIWITFRIKRAERLFKNRSGMLLGLLGLEGRIGRPSSPNNPTTNRTLKRKDQWTDRIFKQRKWLPLPTFEKESGLEGLIVRSWWEGRPNSNYFQRSGWGALPNNKEPKNCYKTINRLPFFQSVWLPGFVGSSPEAQGEVKELWSLRLAMRSNDGSCVVRGLGQPIRPFQLLSTKDGGPLPSFKRRKVGKGRPNTSLTFPFLTPISNNFQRSDHNGLLRTQKRSQPQADLISEFSISEAACVLLHGSKFILKRPQYSQKEAIRAQKTYSVGLYIPVQLHFEGTKNRQILVRGTPSGLTATNTDPSINPNKLPFVPNTRPDALLVVRGTPSGLPINPTNNNPTSCFAESSIPEFSSNSRILPTWFYFGEIPVMTDRGSFLINGAPRVLVNQIVRCPGIYFKVKLDEKNRRSYIASFLSDYGSWLRIETDRLRPRLWVRIDKSARFPLDLLLKSLGFSSTTMKTLGRAPHPNLGPSKPKEVEAGKDCKGIVRSPLHIRLTSPNKSRTPKTRINSGAKIDRFLGSPFLPASIKALSASELIWKKSNPGRWGSSSAYWTFLYTKFFNPKRYSIGSVGRLRINKRFGRSSSNLIQRNEKGYLSGQAANSEINCLIPTLTPEDILLALDYLMQLVGLGEGPPIRPKNLATNTPNLEPSLAGRAPMRVRTDCRMGGSTFLESKNVGLLGRPSVREGRAPHQGLTPSYKNAILVPSFKNKVGTQSSVYFLDDIDHLKNRRVRLPGEIIQNQFRLALSRVLTGSFSVLGSLVSRDEYGKNKPVASGLELPLPLTKVEGRPISPITPMRIGWQGHPIPSLNKTSNSSFIALPSSFYSQILGGSPPQAFVSILRELFNTSQLSQYMDQTNPLAEITHKRRLSSLGPGGVGRDQAGFAVREIHPSHFGRICPIETPEGQNAGLVGSLASYARINKDGFLQSPAKLCEVLSDSLMKPRVSLPGQESGIVSRRDVSYLFSSEIEDEISLCTADIGRIIKNTEINLSLAQSAARVANHGLLGPDADRLGPDAKQSASYSGWGGCEATPFHLKVVGARWGSKEGTTKLGLDSRMDMLGEGKADEGPFPSSTLKFVRGREGPPIGPNIPLTVDKTLYPSRYKQEFSPRYKERIQFQGISPVQLISVATSLIPFLEHDDANRALMGSNMQRQAVPLMIPEKPFVGTGLEIQAARDSSTLLLTQKSGQITYVDSKTILLKTCSQVVRELGLIGRPNNPSYPELLREGKGRAGLTILATHPTNKPNLTLKFDLAFYLRSNQGTTLRQRPNVQFGEWIEKGGLLADGAATKDGEIALGKNVLLAYMPWEGYNFEDAIVINERLVSEDIYSSIHIDRYEIDTKNLNLLPADASNFIPTFGKEYLTSNPLFYSSLQVTKSTREQNLKAIVAPSLALKDTKTLNQPSLELGGWEVLGEGKGTPSRHNTFTNSNLKKEPEGTKLDFEGIIKIGTWVQEGDILIGKITPIEGKSLSTGVQKANGATRVFSTVRGTPSGLSKEGTLPELSPMRSNLISPNNNPPAQNPNVASMQSKPTHLSKFASQSPKIKISNSPGTQKSNSSPPEYKLLLAIFTGIGVARNSEPDWEATNPSSLIQAQGSSVDPVLFEVQTNTDSYLKKGSKQLGGAFETGQAQDFNSLSVGMDGKGKGREGGPNTNLLATKDNLLIESFNRSKFPDKFNILKNCTDVDSAKISSPGSTKNIRIPGANLNFKNTSLKVGIGIRGRVIECIVPWRELPNENGNRPLTTLISRPNYTAPSFKNIGGMPSNLNKRGLVGNKAIVRSVNPKLQRAVEEGNRIERRNSATDQATHNPTGLDAKRHRFASPNSNQKIVRAALPLTNKHLSQDKKFAPLGQSMIGNLYSRKNATGYSVSGSIQVFIAHKKRIQLGDKMSGRHGNKGIVSLILPPQDMPYLQDGTPVDVVLNPLGVPSRMNVGQVLETLFGLASKYLNQTYRLMPFDEMYGTSTNDSKMVPSIGPFIDRLPNSVVGTHGPNPIFKNSTTQQPDEQNNRTEVSRNLVYSYLRQAKLAAGPGSTWLFDPNNPGKTQIFDGRTGELYHQPVLIGYSYMFKLIHLVDDKIHARSTGPYSLVTQQPLGGRSKKGGQRLGEMEVWALEGFGAASILQEFLTIKSDEIYSRNTFLFNLMRRDNHGKTPSVLARPILGSVPGLDRVSSNSSQQLRSSKEGSPTNHSSVLLNYPPESFRVLVNELQALCLSVYYNPDFRLSYPSLLGCETLAGGLATKKFPNRVELSFIKGQK